MCTAHRALITEAKIERADRSNRRDAKPRVSNDFIIPTRSLGYSIRRPQGLL
jgi:hypothetical protein